MKAVAALQNRSMHHLFAQSFYSSQSCVLPEAAAIMNSDLFADPPSIHQEMQNLDVHASTCIQFVHCTNLPFL